MRKAFLTTIAAIALLVPASGLRAAPRPHHLSADRHAHRLRPGRAHRARRGSDRRGRRGRRQRSRSTAASATASSWSAATCTSSSTADVRGDVVLVGGHADARRRARSWPAASTTSRSASGRAATSAGSRSVRFGEFGRWLSLAGTLARVSRARRPDGR